jgi:predicted RNA binding protein YcfA (HicA-like mRNA interferase family)
VKVREAIRAVEQDQWAQVRQKGSHRQFHHPTKPGTVTIAGHPSDEIPPGTLKNIMKQAGIEE